MLVFTRRRGSAIVIGDAIEVVVLRSGRDGVRLGVRAPASVTVHRKEIYDQILQENLRAAQSLSTEHGAPGPPVPTSNTQPSINTSLEESGLQPSLFGPWLTIVRFFTVTLLDSTGCTSHIGERTMWSPSIRTLRLR